ncbi:MULTISPECIES: NAD(P)-dependent alcohol dehydrogenase [Enterobacter cloacae complex]|uniref:Alcohol dehydrogenase n=1 Tax=Enterobacter genomosp. O TaxID=2364150 RepID=A0A0X4ET18_9ENTR|nr:MULTISPECIES: NAD(P)-dependent alcohol dehydrogenase [Enterobacter cloacae complex]KUQ84826.1 alcohol dehydrogenase [Enterobacter genomosp. O]KZP71731.1 alcohol dehydrogenase [Enterobacter hormaechei subsp. xiangfangensis]
MQQHLHRAKAAVIREKGGRFLTEETLLQPPRADEVLVRVVACGVCHTDLIVRDQYFPTPLPVVLGHEGSGVIEVVGSDVKDFSVGDHVVMTYHSCGHCEPCSTGEATYCNHAFALNFGGGRLDGSCSTQDAHGHKIHDHFFGQSSFATYAIANRRNLVKVDKDLPLELLGPLGCGIQTGAGAVFNVLQPRAGTAFAVFGAGAVGLSALMAARVAGAATLIAVDITPGRLELAKSLGATHTINSRECDPVEEIRRITGGGAHCTLETSGIPAVLRQAIDALSTRGTCAIVGAPAAGTEASFDVNDVMTRGRTIRGVIEGESIPSVFIPRLLSLFRQGRFSFDKLVRFYDFEEINQAVADAQNGLVVKPILRIG